MAHHQPSEIDPQQIVHAEDFWHGFMKFGKISVVAIIVLLLLMAAFLL